MPRQPAPATNDHQDLAALWACRLLVKAGGHKRFIGSRGFRDDDLLRFIGLDHLEDDEFDIRGARRALRERLHILEQDHVQLRGRLTSNIDRLGKTLGLTRDEKRVLCFAVISEIFPELREAVDCALPAYRGQLARLLGLALGMSAEAVDAAISPTSRLTRSGLTKVSVNNGLIGNGLDFDLLDGLAGALIGEFDHLESVFQALFRPAPPAELATRDFPHVRADITRLRRLLDNARRQGLSGINVLIYGGPGVGKTELVKTLAKSLRSTLYEIAYADDDGDPVTGTRRFRSFQLCQQLLRRRSRALIVFDEIEDVFSESPPSFLNPRRHNVGKAWINRQLEENAVPTFWLSNSIGCIDPAHLRRFDYVLELGTPPRQVRRRMLEQACRGLNVSERWRERVSECSALTPALVEQAARVARLTATPNDAADTEAVLQQTVDRQLKLQGRRLPPRRHADDWLPYSLDCVNTPQDLGAVVEGLRRSGRGTLLLYGPPGTGKTAFAHHLAERLDRPLLKRPTSEVLSMWVGGTERNLAAMFEEARAEDALLLLDEADSLLRSRRGAQQSWEVTQVNELLVQMEQFDGIFLCATYFLEVTDDAALRRFDLKLKLDYPSDAQRWQLFQSLCQRLQLTLSTREAAAARQALSALPNLAPGDFATLARRAALVAPPDAAALLEQLREESRLKPDGQKRRIGFVAG